MRHNEERFILCMLFIILSINLLANEKNIKMIILGGYECSRYFEKSLIDREREYIYTYNPEKNIFVKFSDIYRGTKPKVSPMGTYVLFWGTDKKDVPIKNKTGGLNKTLQLLLFLTEGKYIKSIPISEGDIVWSPGEDKILFVERPYEEMRHSETNPIWLIDLATLKKTKLPEKGDKVKWTKFDSSIYYHSSERRKVVKYDPAKHTLSQRIILRQIFVQMVKYYLSDNHQ